MGYQDPNHDKLDYKFRRSNGERGQRTGGFKARGIIQLDKTGRPARLLPEYGPDGHKPISKKAFKKNTRRARRYNRIEEEAML